MILFIFLLSFSSLLPIFQDRSGEEGVLNEGFQYEEQGEYELALETWASAFTELNVPSVAIGREYLRLVTEQKLRQHYETGSAMYIWGFHADVIEPNREALKQELAMLQPLAEPVTYRQWEDLLNNNDPDLYRYLRNFWQQLDPTPGTRYNERLIEHWERIAYARENYTLRTDPPYGTDDRGPAYIRYGEPNVIRTGEITMSVSDVNSTCRQLPGCDELLAVEAVMMMDPRPTYEIWVYEKPDPNMGYNLVLIFGRTSLSYFRQVDVIENFIPTRAFYSTIGSSVATPGMIMQYNYYRQLAYIDNFFADRFGALWSNLDTAADGHLASVTMTRAEAMYQQHLSVVETRRNLRIAPRETSTYNKQMSVINLDVYYYRLLNEQNQPVLAIFLESWPNMALLFDLAVNDDRIFKEDSTSIESAISFYNLMHGIQFVGDGGDVLTQSRLPGNLVVDVENEIPSSSIFIVPHNEETQKMVFYAELNNYHPDSAPLTDSPFPEILRGLGQAESTMPEPLYRGADSLVMADLVLGWQMETGEPGGTLFPFVVANNRKIPRGEELALHLELYNLKQDPSGFTNFSVEYKIIPVRRMAWLRRASYEMGLTLDFETTEHRFTENLEIRTRELPSGRYELRFKVIDNISQDEKARSIEFEVVE